MTNSELIENCIAAYAGTVGGLQNAMQGSRYGSAPRHAMFGFTAAAHRLAVTALPPSRPTRMPPQQFEFPGLPVLGAVRRAFRQQPAAATPVPARTASH